MRFIKKLYLSAILLISPTLILSETFCIKNQEELLNALAISSSNNENDFLRIIQDTKTKEIPLPSEVGYFIKIESGYTSDCSFREVIPEKFSETQQQSVLSNIALEAQQSTTGPTPSNEVTSKEETLQSTALAEGSEVTVIGVPAYAWRHGCGPTALGMVIGYWDTKGFEKLFDGDATTQTNSVNQGIASQDGVSGHYEDYSVPKDSYPNLLLDKSEDPVGDEHISDSIADFMYTSWSSWNNYYGWSWSNHITTAFTSYLQTRSSSYEALTESYYYTSNLTQDILIREIDAQRPMVFLVDTNADGYTDHFVTIVGYRIEGDTLYYGCLDTWYPHETIRWEKFRGLSTDYAWGIRGGYSFQIKDTSKPVIAPWLMLLLSN